jgi:hypothetical protein
MRTTRQEGGRNGGLRKTRSRVERFYSVEGIGSLGEEPKGILEIDLFYFGYTANQAGVTGSFWAQ